MTYPEDFCVKQSTPGGPGGISFSSFINPIDVTLADGTIIQPAFTISKIDAWVVDNRLLGIKVYYSNTADGYRSTDQSEQFGREGGTKKSFTFEVGESIARLIIYRAETGSGTFSGGFSFDTTMRRSFSAQSDNSTSPSEMIVGYGLLVGVSGTSGDEINSLGFWLVNNGSDLKLDNVTYLATPEVPDPTTFDTVTYINASSVTITETFSKTWTVLDSQSWSNTQGAETSQSLTVGVSAEVFSIGVSASGTATWIQTTQTTNSTEFSETSETNFILETPVEPGQIINLEVAYFAGNYNLPYFGVASLTITPSVTLQFYISGVATGTTQSDLSATTTEG